MHQQARNNPSKQNTGQQNNNDKPRGGQTMQAISAPYNFVPLADTVVIPEWGHLVSHDIPFRDGLCGSIDFTLTAHTPIMIGGRRKKQGDSTAVDFFQTPDGQYAIPGSSLKGMIRNVLEIATFSRFRQVDDRRLSVRDLHYAPYRNQMTTTKNGAFLPLTKAGWLSFSDNHWRITPCNFSRIEHDELAKYSNDSWWKSAPRTEIDTKTKLHKEHTFKYHRWTKKCELPLDISFDAEPLKAHDKHSSKKPLCYSRAYNLGKGSLHGTLVFTGQPSKRIPNKSGCKHMEFIFHSEQSDHIPVNHKTWHDFIEIHKESAEWNYWCKQKRIPVFYKSEDGKNIDAIGMTMMFRLPYTHSIHDMIGHSSPTHISADAPDFADLLFGHIDELDGKTSLKGRVYFEIATQQTENHPMEHTKVVLSEPKPSYYPNYVRQRVNNGNRLSGNDYQTYFDNHATLRGWKRYPSRPGINTNGSEGSDSISTVIRPLPKGSQFNGRVVFHNLKPEELGALLWSMTLDENKNLRHGIGMAKPYGYGQVSMDIKATNIIPNDPLSPKPDTKELIKKFSSYMNKRVPKAWRNTTQIRTLLAMADPECARKSENRLEYMKLANKEFINAKKAHLVLGEHLQTSNTSKTSETKTAPHITPKKS